MRLLHLAPQNVDVGKVVTQGGRTVAEWQAQRTQIHECRVGPRFARSVERDFNRTASVTLIAEAAGDADDAHSRVSFWIGHAWLDGPLALGIVAGRCALAD